MIDFEYFRLDNGLKVYLHQDKTTPMAVVNITYNVGSRDEDENKTGFAHLFEHLMFGGSKHIPHFDTPLQKVGGENNAFTSPDITNYYITLPANNIETALWLESDRMLSLSFDPKVLEIQRKVVIEEFKQRYLNQPYGDIWLKMRPLAYKMHPYKWATIGKEIAHIEDATMDDVKNFFFRYYRPDNAVMVIAGNFDLKTIQPLVQKWFGDIPAGNMAKRSLPAEPVQTEARWAEAEAKVPQHAIYKAFHTPGRYESDFSEIDLLSDILGRGKSARLYTRLVKEQQIFSTIGAHITGSLDTGLLFIHGNLNEGISMKKGNEAIEKVLDELIANPLGHEELDKVKNQAESSLQFAEVDLLHRAMGLSFAANYGDPNLYNQEIDKMRAVNIEGLSRVASQILNKDKANTLFYYSKN